MNGPKTLLESEDNWVTDIGMFIPGKQVVFRGKDLFSELKNIRWMGLYLYGITGRFFSERQLCLIEAMWVIAISYPDPRIWNNRVAALAGTTRSSSPLAMSAATAVTEATVYGHRPNKGAMVFLLRTQEQLNAGANLEELVLKELQQRRKIFGYGRPQVVDAGIDERIAPILEVAHRLELDSGQYIELALEIDRILANSRYRIRMTVAALTAALCADMELTPDEFVALATPAYIGGMTPCYLDALKHPEGSLFPIRCPRIDYRGEPPRIWD